MTNYKNTQTTNFIFNIINPIKGKSYPIMPPQDFCSPHIRIPRFVDPLTNNNLSISPNFDVARLKWPLSRSKTHSTFVLMESIAWLPLLCHLRRSPTNNKIKKFIKTKDYNNKKHVVLVLYRCAHFPFLWN
jgi:hypothetical protein